MHILNKGKYIVNIYLYFISKTKVSQYIREEKKNCMKKNNKYVLWGITAFLVVLGGLLAYYVIFHLNNFKSIINRIIVIMMPVIDGIILAYLLTPLVNTIERKILKPIFDTIHYKKKSHRRFLAIILTFIFVGFAIYEFFALVIPQIINSVQTIIIQFPSYLEKIDIFISNLLEDNPDVEQMITGLLDQYSDYLETLLNEKIIPQINNLIMTVSMSIYAIIKNLWNLIIGLIISIYLLSGKESFAAQAKKIVYAIKPVESANRFISNVRFSSKTFSGFFIGKILDSIIIGCICFVVTNIIGTPFPVLISVIIGVTNIIPFFGPFLGAIPSLFLILLINPIQAFYFLLFVIILQQVDGNIIGPKILGSSTGLPGFWVIFAITLFGGLFGVLGMILGVPVFAVFFAFMKSLIETRLEKKELPKETKKYLRLLYIDMEENNTFVEMNADNPKPFEGITHILVRGQHRLKHRESIRKTEDEENTDDESNQSN